LTAAAAAAVIALCLAGCGSAAAPAPPSHPDARRFLSVDAAARTVRLSVVLGYGSEASLQDVDGARKGGLLFSVPVGWRVRFECLNRLLTARYACALAPAPGVSQVQRGVTYVVHPADGLAAGQSATFTFAPIAVSRYRIVGLTRSGSSWVPSTGMWAVLRVSAGGVPQAQWLR
jgi:Sulfocyanin (SoxE) domain